MSALSLNNTYDYAYLNDMNEYNSISEQLYRKKKRIALYKNKCKLEKSCFCNVTKIFLIPQNSKRRSKSQESMNPAITSSKSKAELTSVNSEMTGNENKIINYGTNPAAFDGAVADGHIIFLH